MSDIWSCPLTFPLKDFFLQSSPDDIIQSTSTKPWLCPLCPPLPGPLFLHGSFCCESWQPWEDTSTHPLGPWPSCIPSQLESCAARFRPKSFTEMRHFHYLSISSALRIMHPIYTEWASELSPSMSVYKVINIQIAKFSGRLLTICLSLENQNKVGGHHTEVPLPSCSFFKKHKCRRQHSGGQHSLSHDPFLCHFWGYISLWNNFKRTWKL